MAKPLGVVVLLILAGLGSASAQTYSYRFSSCSSGVSMQVTFPVKPPVTMVPGPAYSFSYISLSATFSLTIGGATQVFNGLAAAIVQYVPAAGPDGIAQTVVDFDPSELQGGPHWHVNLQAGGSLLPSGLTPTLPPLSAWVYPVGPPMYFDFIEVDGQFYHMDSFGACSASGSGSASGIDTDKSLGLACDFPGCVSCGEPINVGTGNVFENFTDYQTTGSNKLGFTRYYNSMAGSTTYAGTLGVNWRSTYDGYLRLSASSVIAERPDGQQVTFKLTNGAWTTDTDLDYKLTNSGSTWTLTDLEGFRRNLQRHQLERGSAPIHPRAQRLHPDAAVRFEQ